MKFFNLKFSQKRFIFITIVIPLKLFSPNRLISVIKLCSFNNFTQRSKVLKLILKFSLNCLSCKYDTITFFFFLVTGLNSTSEFTDLCQTKRTDRVLGSHLTLTMRVWRYPPWSVSFYENELQMQLEVTLRLSF